MVAEATGLTEIRQVLEGEGECDRLGKVDFDVVLWLVDVRVRSKRHGAVPNVAIAFERDAILCAFDGDCTLGSAMS